MAIVSVGEKCLIRVRTGYVGHVLNSLYTARVSLALSRSYCLFEFSCICLDGIYFTVTIDDVDSRALIVSIGLIGNGCGCNSDLCISILIADRRLQSIRP